MGLERCSCLQWLQSSQHSWLGAGEVQCVPTPYLECLQGYQCREVGVQ